MGGSFLKDTGVQISPCTYYRMHLFNHRFSYTGMGHVFFYEQHMSVIRLEPQKELFTAGPYGFSRNPLYLGGNVFIFLEPVQNLFNNKERKAKTTI